MLAACPELDSSHLKLSHAEKELIGIGSHLNVDEEYLLEDRQNEAAVMTNKDTDDMYDPWNWSAISAPLSEGFSADWAQNEDLEALWWAASGILPVIYNSQIDADILSKGSTVQAEGSVAALKKPEEYISKNASYSELVDHSTTNFGNNSTSQQGMDGLWNRVHSSSSQDPLSLFKEVIPGLTTSFQTETDRSVIEQPASGLQDKGKEPVREIGPAFNMDAYFDSAPFHQRFDLPDNPDANYHSGGTVNTDNAMLNDFPTENFSKDYDVYDESLSTFCGSAYDFA